MDRLPTALFRDIVRALRGDQTGVVIVALAIVTMIGMVAGAPAWAFAAVMAFFCACHVLSHWLKGEQERRMKILNNDARVKEMEQAARKRLRAKRVAAPPQD